MEVNQNNIEEQILLYVDGELSTAEAAALLQYIALHPEWRTLLDEYRSLVLPQEEELVFEGKEALLKPEPQVLPLKKGNSLGRVRWAAAVVLIAGAAGLTWMLGGPGEGSVLPAATGIALQPKEAAAPNDTAMQPRALNPASTAVAAVQPSPVHTHRQAQQPPVQQVAQLQAAHPEPQHDEHIAPIQGSRPAAMEVGNEQQLAQEMQRPETLSPETTEGAVAIKTETLPGWLPVSGEKLEGVNDLISHIREVKEKVAAKATELRRTTFVIRLGEREIAFKK